jgi:predicted butyrate kinase (DUF1464 family)
LLGYEIGLVSQERYEKTVKIKRELEEKRLILESIVKPLTEWQNILNPTNIVFTSNSKKRYFMTIKNSVKHSCMILFYVF